MFAHRHGDSRSCGASTNVIGQDFVTVDGQLWSVDGDPNDHGSGELISSRAWLTIGGKPVICVNDGAEPDTLCFIVGPPHCNPSATGSASLVDVS